MKLSGATSKRLLLSVGALGVSASIAGMGTFASFTSTTSASHGVTSGTVTIALGATGAVTNRLTLNASGLVPGDTVQRAFDITNSGNQSLASLVMTTTASPSSALDTDVTNGLQMVVDRCPSAWVEAGVSPAFTYTCGGVISSVIASRAVIGSALSMTGLSALTNGGTDHLRVTLTLPSGAGNTLQGVTSTISYSFLGTQRLATNQ